MQREEVFAYTAGCYSGEPASCTFACPFRLDLRSFLKKAAKGRWSSALKELKTVLPFPVVVNALCPRPCEGACQRCTVLGEEAVAIGEIERLCLTQGEKKERAAYVLPPLPQRIAVIGAGPSGLSAALQLSRKRYQVTVFEQNAGWGGSLCNHARFVDFDSDFAKGFASSNVQFSFETAVDDLDALQDYDVVVLATGKDGAHFGLLDTWNAQLGTTSDPRVFLLGEMAEQSLIEGMAHASTLAKAIEAYLQSGNPEHAAEQWDRSKCTRYVPHRNPEPMPRVTSAGESYTAEEAQAEAARCMQCDCEACMEACELLIQYKKKPPRIAIDVAQDGQTRNSVSSACITRQTWSCNQCGRCASQCDEGVDLRGLFALSRKDRVESGAYPPAFHGYWMDELSQSTGEAELIRSAPGTEQCTYAFFPGCRLGGANPAYVTRSYQKLLDQLGSVGIMLSCCGIPALWAGEGQRFFGHLSKLRQAWEDMGRPTLIYACASCARLFREQLPEIPLLSLYEVLEPISCADEERVAMFDPCAASGMAELKQSVRTLAEKCGLELSNYDSDGKCCGFGGHMQLANPALYDAITANRCAETDAPFLVYCANCMEVFRAGGKKAAHVLDYALGLESEPTHTLDEKRKNRLAVKAQLLREYWDEEAVFMSNVWDELKLAFSDEAIETMENSLIPADVVREIIWRSEQNGDGFENEAGEVLCRMAGAYLTYWVCYKREGESFLVLHVYAHRMHIREEE